MKTKHFITEDEDAANKQAEIWASQSGSLFSIYRFGFKKFLVLRTCDQHPKRLRFLAIYSRTGKVGS